MFTQSAPYPEMLQLVCYLKKRYGLRIAVVNNEARELNLHRIQRFKLGEFVDFFVSSCFVHIRKPDADIYRLALDMVQTPAQQVLYIDDTPMFVQIAKGLGMQSILHTDYRSTSMKLAALGLPNAERGICENS
jgi:putative hydrolase of the HAD superfamily